MNNGSGGGRSHTDNSENPDIVNGSVRSRNRLLLILSALLWLQCGCDSEAEFSQPDPAIAARLEKARQEALRKSHEGSTPETAVAQTAARPDTATGDTQDSTLSGRPSVSDSEGDSDVMPAVATNSALPDGSDGSLPVSASDSNAAAASEGVVAAEPAATSAGDGAGGSMVDRADGRATADAAAAAAEKENSDASVADNASSLLNKLTASEPESDTPKKTSPRSAVRDAADGLRRFGRRTVTAAVWMRLNAVLPQRYTLSSDEYAWSLAGTAGPHRVGVLSTRPENISTDKVFVRDADKRVLASSRVRFEPEVREVTGVPADIMSLEMTADGGTVLLGTADGRMIARSCASARDLDLYARDLRLLLDDYRQSVRVSDSAVMLIRRLPGERILTVDSRAAAAVWSVADVLPAPPDVEALTPETPRGAESEVLKPEPLMTPTIPASAVLDVCATSDGEQLCFVSADESVTVFSLADGAVTASFNAANFDDTQPTAAAFLPGGDGLAVGLADGRVLLCSTDNGGRFVGQDSAGQTVPWVEAFAHDPQSAAAEASVTCLQMRHDGILLCVGTARGVVHQVDIARRERILSENLHSSEVLRLHSSVEGLYSISADRKVIRSDIPPEEELLPAGLKLPVKLELPSDPTLQITNRKSADEDEEEVAAARNAAADPFLRPRYLGKDFNTEDAADETMIGIRPADIGEALLAHQLRAASPEDRHARRIAYVKYKRSDSAAEGIRPVAGTPELSEPESVGEIESDFVFSSRPYRRVILSVSDDGHLVAASQYWPDGFFGKSSADQPVQIWDVTAGIRMRCWDKSQGLRALQFADADRLHSFPADSRRVISQGTRSRDRELRRLGSSLSPDRQRAVLANAGVPQATSMAVSLLDVATDTTTDGLEAFEALTTAVAFSSDGTGVFAAIRERDRTRLLDLDAATLEVRQEIISEPLSGNWKPGTIDLQDGRFGPVLLLPSSGGRYLLTYGEHQEGYSIRIWQKRGNRWSSEEKDVIVISGDGPMLEPAMADRAVTWIDNKESRIAVVGPETLTVYDVRRNRIEASVPIPEVQGHQPATSLSPDGRWFVAGDGEGKIWVFSLTRLKQKPQTFDVHTGPVAGIGFSADSRFMATAGEDNRIRVWRCDGVLD